MGNTWKGIKLYGLIEQENKMENKSRERLYSQIVELHGKVVYTYTAHHKIQNRLENYNNIIKIIQIVLTSISTVGFLATVISDKVLLAWIGGIASALSLGLNLYMKDNNLKEYAQKHKEAADALWEVREAYSSLITDFDDLDNGCIRDRRDKIYKDWAKINKLYPGTDKKSYKESQEALQREEEQTFNSGEAELFLPSYDRERNK